MTMDFSETLTRFASPLPIYVEDVEGSYDSPDRPGEWVWSTPVLRVGKDGVTPKRIKTIVLALSVQTLFFYKEGNTSDGGIALLTQEKLHFTNIHAAQKELDKQSYVLYQDMRFRVVGDGFISGWDVLTGNANFKCYHCLRDVQ